MSILLETRLSECGLGISSHFGTSLEPARWNKRVTYYTTVGSDTVVDYVEFFMDDVLLFRHRYLYDLNGNETELIVE